MGFRREYRFESNNNPFSSLFAIIVMALVFVGLFILGRFVFRILYFLTPLMLIATAIIDYKVIVNYAKWLIDMIRRNTLLGISATVLSLIFFPVVSAMLLGRALFKRQVRKAQEEQQQAKPGEYLDFEEIAEDKTLKLPRYEEPKREEKKDDRYDQFFN